MPRPSVTPGSSPGSPIPSSATPRVQRDGTLSAGGQPALLQLRRVRSADRSSSPKSTTARIRRSSGSPAKAIGKRKRRLHHTVSSRRRWKSWRFLAEPLVPAAALQAIYNPTARPGRIPFAGNIIPSSMMNPVGLAMASYYPAPNTATPYYGATELQRHGDHLRSRRPGHRENRSGVRLQGSLERVRTCTTAAAKNPTHGSASAIRARRIRACWCGTSTPLRPTLTLHADPYHGGFLCATASTGFPTRPTSWPVRDRYDEVGLPAVSTSPNCPMTLSRQLP